MLERWAARCNGAVVEQELRYAAVLELASLHDQIPRTLGR